MGVNVREALMQRLDMLSEEQALAVLMRMEADEVLRAQPIPPDVIATLKRQRANPGKIYTTEEARARLGLEPIPYPTVNRSAPVVQF